MSADRSIEDPKTAPSELNPLRTLDITETINGAAGLVVGHLGRVAAVLLVTNIPLLAWQLLAVVTTNDWPAPSRYRAAQDAYALLEFGAGMITSKNFSARQLVGTSVAFLASLLQTATLTPLLAAWFRGRAASPPAALDAAMQRLPQLLLAYLPAAVLMLAATWLYALSDVAAALAVAALLFILPCFLFIPHTVMIEKRGPLDALRRSASLLRGRYWQVFGRWLMFEVVLLFLTAIPTFVAGMASVTLPPGPRLTVVTILAGNLAVLIMEPLRDAMLTLQYYQLLRKRREAT